MPFDLDKWPQGRLLIRQHELLVSLQSLSRDCKLTQCQNLLFPMLDAIEESTGTLERLIRIPRMRDSYVIARVVYETAVNTCFILAAGEDVAERAVRYSRQKSIRDLDRKFYIGDDERRLKWSGVDELLSDPLNQELLEEFTTKSGREVTAWTEKNVPERLKTIHAKYGAAAENLFWHSCFIVMPQKSPMEACSASCSLGVRRNLRVREQLRIYASFARAISATS